MGITHFFKNSARIVYETIYQFVEDDCYTKASTLTFFTMQSLVPFLAAVLGVASGFGLQHYLEQLLTKAFPEQETVMKYAIQIAHTVLSELNSGLIAGLGVLFILYTNITLLGYIESALNYIWKIKTPRTFGRKISDYLAFIIICPIILVASSSFTVYLKTEVEMLRDYSYLHSVSNLLLSSFNLVPLVLSWIVFFLLYYFMPNEKLTIWPRVVAAIVAGTLFQLWQVVFITLQIKIFNYNLTYGALAILPLFLIWLQVSWMIALGGAELAGNIEMAHFIQLNHITGTTEKINNRQMGLLVLYECLRAFYTKESAPSDIQISKKLKIPLNKTQKMLDILTKGNVLSPVAFKDAPQGFHPLFDPSQYSLLQICELIDQDNQEQITVGSSDALTAINRVLQNMDHVIDESPANIKLNQFIQETL